MLQKKRQKGNEAEKIAEKHDHERVDVTAYMLDRRMHPRKSEGGDNHQGNAAQSAVAWFVQERVQRQMG
jgi:hypothetical protein